MKTLHYPVVEIGLRSGEVHVSELAWPDARYLFDRLVGELKQFFNEKGDIQLAPQAIVEAITNNINLAEWLVTKSTGKDEAWVKARTVSEILELATEAAVLNVGVITDRLKNAQSRLSSLITGPIKTPTIVPLPEKPSIDSSPASATS